MTVFIDSSVFVAYGNMDDLHHNKSKKIIEDIASKKYGEIFTSDYVFDESVTVALVRTKDLDKAVKLGKLILESEITLLIVDDIIFKEAWRLFERDNRQKMSFTDLTNIAFMRTYEIGYIASFDEAFKSVEGIMVVD